MTTWGWVWLVGGALLSGALLFVLIQFLTFERGIHQAFGVELNAIGFWVQVHFNAKLPHWFNVTGFAMSGDVWMFWPRNLVKLEDLLHELCHSCWEEDLVRRHGKRLGRALYKLHSGWQRLTQWVHNRRGMEEDARRGAKILRPSGEGDVVLYGRTFHIKIDPKQLQGFQ